MKTSRSIPLEAARYGELYAYYGGLLPSETREVLELHLDEDFSLAEIAARYGLSRQAISARIRRGLAELDKNETVLSLKKNEDRTRLLIEKAIDALDLGDTGKARKLLLQLSGGRTGQDE